MTRWQSAVFCAEHMLRNIGRRAAESSGQVFLPSPIFLEKTDAMFDLNQGISGF